MKEPLSLIESGFPFFAKLSFLYCLFSFVFVKIFSISFPLSPLITKRCYEPDTYHAIHPRCWFPRYMVAGCIKRSPSAMTPNAENQIKKINFFLIQKERETNRQIDWERNRDKHTVRQIEIQFCFFLINAHLARDFWIQCITCIEVR